MLWLLGCGGVALRIHGYLLLGTLGAEVEWVVLVVPAAATLGEEVGLQPLNGLPQARCSA